MPIHNPNPDPYANALLGLAVSMSTGNPSTFIEEQERNGQAEIVNSDVLPAKMGDRAAYEAVGFTFGDPVKGDDLFVHATLPAGWRREGTDHAMHSSIIDSLGRKRVSVFYKAAFYDRRANMSLITVSWYAYDCLNLYGDGGPKTPVLDGQWATKEAFAGALESWATREEADATDLEASLGRRDPDNAEACRKIAERQRSQVAMAREFATQVRTA